MKLTVLCRWSQVALGTYMCGPGPLLGPMFGVVLGPFWRLSRPHLGYSWTLLGSLGLSSWLLVPLVKTLHAFFKSFGLMLIHLGQ